MPEDWMTPNEAKARLGFPACVRHDLCSYPACDCDVAAPSFANPHPVPMPIVAREGKCGYPGCNCGGPHNPNPAYPPGRFPVCEALRAGSCRYPACRCGGHSNLLPPRPDRLATPPGFWTTMLAYAFMLAALGFASLGAWSLGLGELFR